MRNGKVEILAPAGSYESMKAAINAGADAVYIGGSRFGARAYADNPDEENLVKAIEFVHLHGKKLYMTVNTLVKERELSELSGFLRPYYEAGLDGVIIQDLGVFRYIRDHFPGLPLHVNTQMTVTGKYGAKSLKEMGASRIVPARELSLDELRAMYAETGMEIEVFVHGALCYCYSGQCLFSSLIGGRSGNRGRCAQTCRLPFEVRQDGKSLNRKNEKYVLSLKDLCTLDILPDILETGVCSLKIEGRMKSPRYTAGVVSVYRKYVDMYLNEGKSGYHVDESDRRMLLELFDRGGQTDGYYKRHNGRDMVVLKEKPAFREGSQELYDTLDRLYVNAEKKEPVTGEAWIAPGKKTRLTVSLAGQRQTEKKRVASVSAYVEGAPAEEAKSAPMTEERIRKQLMKTGGSPFVFESLEIHMEGDVFLPVQELNRMRREALEALEHGIYDLYRRKAPEEKSGTALRETVHAAAPLRPEFNALVSTKEQFSACLERFGAWKKEKGGEFGIYLASESFDAGTWKQASEACHEKGISCYLMLPRIFRGEAESYFLRNRERLLEAGFDVLGVASMEEPEFVKQQFPGRKLFFDHGMYVFNHLAKEAMEELGACRVTVPVELNRREIADAGAGGEMIVYGRLPMMVSAQCIHRTLSGCDKKPGVLWMKDRKGKEFPVENQCRFCYNTIWNAAPLSLHGLSDEVMGLGAEALRLNFTLEDRRETEAVLSAFYREFILGEDAGAAAGDFTRGHFKRGIE